MAKKRSYRNGSIEERNGAFRLRYSVGGKKFAKTLPVGTTKTEASKQLRLLLGQADNGEHVVPSRVTVDQWFDQWLAIGAPGQKKEPVGRRTLERYTQLLAEHVRPELGKRPIQQLRSNEIDKLYAGLATKVSPWTRRPLSKTTQRHVHVVFASALATAERSGTIVANPMKKTQIKPKKGEVDHGIALDADDLATLVAGFRPTRLYLIVALAAATGMRRNELLSLRWSDFDADKKTLKIERALEATKNAITKKPEVKFKAPKTARGKRTVDLNPGTVEVLIQERRKHQQIMAGIPDGTDIDLSLIKLPATALIFPADLEKESPTFIKTRDPHDVSRAFRMVARKLFPRMRFHNLRHGHSTILLDAGVPVHRVAAPIGDDPAILLRTYAMLTKKKSDAMTDAVNALGTLILKN